MFFTGFVEMRGRARGFSSSSTGLYKNLTLNRHLNSKVEVEVYLRWKP